MTPFHVTFKAILALRSAKPDKPKFTWYMVTGLSEPGELEGYNPLPLQKKSHFLGIKIQQWK